MPVNLEFGEIVLAVFGIKILDLDGAAVLKLEEQTVRALRPDYRRLVGGKIKNKPGIWKRGDDGVLPFRGGGTVMFDMIFSPWFL
ncbi:MAG: hypothetical protein LBR31_06805 [Desulfovibrio sp.]|nr:hypothetical protein [Desulfovibrio sp.]